MSKYFLSSCIIIKDESRYLEEWLLFHQLQGVEHAYLYDNGSIDNTKEILKPYIDKGLVTLHDLPGACKQREAYDHCIETYKKETRWCTFLDIDEFLYSPQAVTVAEVIKNMCRFHMFGAIAVHWWLFGSNNHIEEPDGLVIENFTKKARKVDQHVKSICCMDLTVSHGSNAHAFKLKVPAVDENLMKLPEEYAVREGGSADILRINHYHCKALNTYRKKCAKGRVDITTPRNFETNWPIHNLNDVSDTYLADTYSDKIKALIK